MAALKHIDTPAVPMPLFRPGIDRSDVTCLPFVREKRKGDTGRHFWTCPESVNYTDDCETGKRFAAAWLIYEKECGIITGGILTWIVRDMEGALSRGSKSSGFAVGFLTHVAWYAISLAAQCRSSEIESTLNSQLAMEHEVMEADRMRRRK